MKYDIDFNGFWLPHADENMPKGWQPIGTVCVGYITMVLLKNRERFEGYCRPLGKLPAEYHVFNGNDCKAIAAEYRRFVDANNQDKPDASDAPVRSRGRPASGLKRPRSYSVTDDEHEQLKQLGGGNASRGLTVALQAAGRQQSAG